MSYADFIFYKNCRSIIDKGITDNDFEVRPKWKDGTPAHTTKILYQQNRYKLDKDSIPVMTLRKQGIKNAIDEILWIYQRKTSDLSKLNSHIWDSWDVGDGTIGHAYGYQIGLASKHHKYHAGEDLSGIQCEVKDDWVYMSQTDAVLWDLKNNPGSRSIMTNTYNHIDLADMGLRPCAYSMHYIVTMDQDRNMILNGKLIQRSQDMLTANNWNVIQYAVLLQMFAQVCNMKPGIFVHEVADMHIYDWHIPLVKEMLTNFDFTRLHARPAVTDRSEEFLGADVPYPYPNPKFWINPDITNFYDFKVGDFALQDYQYCEFNHKIEVAV